MVFNLGWQGLHFIYVFSPLLRTVLVEILQIRLDKNKDTSVLLESHFLSGNLAVNYL